MIPDSICATMVSGFTYLPQSTAQTTRWTSTFPLGSTETSATWATKLPYDSWTAIPRPCPAGSGVPQPAFSAASSSTPRWRGLSARRARRNSKGSFPAHGPPRRGSSPPRRRCASVPPSATTGPAPRAVASGGQRGGSGWRRECPGRLRPKSRLSHF